MSAVRAATIDDLPRLCRTTMHAFADDPVMRWLYPADDDYYAGDGQVLRYVFRRWLAHGSTFTTDDCVSVAAFVPPGRPPVDVQVEPDMPAFADDLVDKFMAISACLAAYTPAEPHWYLNSLATHPHWQRQGLGALVISPVVQRCDQDGLPLYPKVPVQLERLAAEMFARHTELTARRRRR